jgi:hypothetical protein
MDFLTAKVGKERWGDLADILQKFTELEIRTAAYAHPTINEGRIVNTKINFLQSFCSYERG